MGGRGHVDEDQLVGAQGSAQAAQEEHGVDAGATRTRGGLAAIDLAQLADVLPERRAGAPADRVAIDQQPVEEHP